MEKELRERIDNLEEKLFNNEDILGAIEEMEIREKLSFLKKIYNALYDDFI